MPACPGCFTCGTPVQLLLRSSHPASCLRTPRLEITSVSTVTQLLKAIARIGIPGCVAIAPDLCEKQPPAIPLTLLVQLVHLPNHLPPSFLPASHQTPIHPLVQLPIILLPIPPTSSAPSLHVGLGLPLSCPLNEAGLPFLSLAGLHDSLPLCQTLPCSAAPLPPEGVCTGAHPVPARFRTHHLRGLFSVQCVCGGGCCYLRGTHSGMCLGVHN